METGVKYVFWGGNSIIAHTLCYSRVGQKLMCRCCRTYGSFSILGGH